MPAVTPAGFTLVGCRFNEIFRTAFSMIRWTFLGKSETTLRSPRGTLYM